MALYYDLKVFKDVYQLILKIFEYTQGFLREYKYTLGQDMKREQPEPPRPVRLAAVCGQVDYRGIVPV